MQEERKKRKYRVGFVVSNSKDGKTKYVSVKRTYRHFLYDRVVRSNNKFAVHDENGISNIGDMVRIIESRPLSKTKKWIIVKVLNKGLL
ncbi:MAG: 30S ribosomal protein S17 [Endomicrobium sp.]|jgi:small subunit ribosomal protein S17|nr:30S ribosomal protein S17 [Endomicrobium sp.]